MCGPGGGNMSAVADWARISDKVRGNLENPFDYEGVLDTYQEVSE